MAGGTFMGKMTELKSLAARAFVPGGLWHPEHEVGLNGVRCLL